MRVCAYQYSGFTLVALVCVLAACGSDESTPAEPDAGTGLEIPQPVDPISCENACSRAAKCAEALVTREDCLVLCQNNQDPHKYACCIQYAEGCAGVQSCVNGNFMVCKPEGPPWVVLSLFDDCECGEPGKTIPKNAECVNVDHDNPCVSGVCFKPVVSNKTPFCAIRCGAEFPKCPEELVCEQTAKTDYCKRPFD